MRNVGVVGNPSERSSRTSSPFPALCWDIQQINDYWSSKQQYRLTILTRPFGPHRRFVRNCIVSSTSLSLPQLSLIRPYRAFLIAVDYESWQSRLSCSPLYNLRKAIEKHLPSSRHLNTTSDQSISLPWGATKCPEGD